MLTFFIIYLLSGALIGFLAGLLGIGGGILIIPTLLILFKQQALPQALSMQMAIATSLAIVAIASLSSTYVHFVKGAVLFSIVKKFVPGAVIGSLIGVYFAHYIHSIYLERLFGIFLLLVACQLLLKGNVASTREIHDIKILVTSSLFFGILAGMLGIGGGVFITPFLQWCGFTIRQAVATTAACMVPVAIAGTIAYLLLNPPMIDMPSFTTGFVYWPAFLGIGLTSVLFAPLGARVAHIISTTLLRKLFAVFLIIVALKMLMF